MRKIAEIESDIDAVNKTINILAAKHSALHEELRETKLPANQTANYLLKQRDYDIISDVLMGASIKAAADHYGFTRGHIRYIVFKHCRKLISEIKGCLLNMSGVQRLTLHTFRKANIDILQLLQEKVEA